MLKKISQTIALVGIFVVTLAATGNIQALKERVNPSSSSITFLVFSAPWCEPCKQLAPVVQELETEYAGKVKFQKVDVDQDSARADYFNITALPTMIILKNGAPTTRQVGPLPKAELAKLIDRALAN